METGLKKNKDKNEKKKKTTTRILVQNVCNIRDNEGMEKPDGGNFKLQPKGNTEMKQIHEDLILIWSCVGVTAMELIAQVHSTLYSTLENSK
jgi:hypothetical protein